jgi:hypothetical protein
MFNLKIEKKCLEIEISIKFRVNNSSKNTYEKDSKWMTKIISLLLNFSSIVAIIKYIIIPLFVI